MLDRLRARPEILALAASVAIFLSIGGWYSADAGTWHEEVALYPNPGLRVLSAGASSGPDADTARREPSCLDPGPPRLIPSSDRPMLNLCVGGRGYPLMVTAYMSGWLYWPSSILRAVHEDDVFRLRALGLVLGVITLFVTFVVVRRIAGPTHAAASVLVTSATSSFVFAHALLVHYELVPWCFLAHGLLALMRCDALRPGAPEGPVPTRWLVAAALSAGLAFASNVKTLFILGPLVALSVHLGVGWARVRPAQWRASALVAALPVLPMILFAWFDPVGAFAGQVRSRAHIAGSVSLGKLLAEPLNLATYWTDVGAYADAISRAPAAPNWPALVLAWGSLIFALASLRRARGGRGADVLAAAGGVLIVAYVGVVVLLYDQQPPANYAPMHAVFGVTTACALVALGERLRPRVGRAAPYAVPAVVLAGTLVLGWNCVRRGHPSDAFAMAINARAQRALVAHLREHPDDAPIVTTTYNLAGVLESLGHGALRPTQAHLFLHACRGSIDDVRACMRRRWRSLLVEEARPPMRVVAPVEFALIEEPNAAEMLPALEDVARSLGRTVRVEGVFRTGRGVPVLAVHRVE